ncbi:MAG TPA: MlaD family protein [Gemmatimonadales bacterium]|nr:MlaD family protein [Gemmatimonadales bacterium]
MKRGNEFAVGLAVLLALGLVVGGAIWLGDAEIGRQQGIHTARFRTVGGLAVGNPVTFRGVRVGRVEAIRLADDDWVEADLRIDRGVELPARPAVIAAASSLFGEWAATIESADAPQSDPNLRLALLEAAAPGDDRWPGATLPDVGQLTAQASRIAGDVAEVTRRIQGVFDSAAVMELKQSILDFAAISNRLVAFAESQTRRLDRIGANVATTSDAFARASISIRNTLARIDTATGSGEVRDIVQGARATTEDLRQAAADLRALAGALRQNEASLVRVLRLTDSLLTRIDSGRGTLGLLASDSALYLETTRAMSQFRQLMTDFQQDPKKYIKISVF